MSKPRLSDVEARVATATEGPWSHEPWGGQNQNGDYAGGNVFDAHGDYLVSEVSDADGALIAASRTDVPALTAAIRAVLAHMDNVEAIGGQPILRYEAIREVLGLHIDLEESNV